MVSGYRLTYYPYGIFSPKPSYAFKIENVYAGYFIEGSGKV